MTSSSETEDNQFFDTRDEVSSVSDLGSECSESCPINGVIESALSYDFWTKKPGSIRERRDNFFKLMGLSPDRPKATDEDVEDDVTDDPKRDFHRFSNGDEAVLASFSDAEPLENGVKEDNPIWKIKNLDNGTEFVAYKQDEDGSVTTFLESGSDKTISLDELQKTFGSSNLVQQLLRKDDSNGLIETVPSKRKPRTSWLQRFSAVAHISDRAKGFTDKTSETDSKAGSAARVRVSKKNSKELSALYVGQEFPAHEGSILTMKFSLDGRFLASGGADGIVRVWKVLEDDNGTNFNARELDPSGFFFWLDHVSKEKSKSFDSTPIGFPRKFFQLSEKPLHEFHGHQGEVLSLSWSKSESLLSSSVDKTVRLWRVGNDRCQRVYSHNNYVTCVEFNPVIENRFISGSIDGKLRIWEVEGGRVVDWTDIKEIVTAVCYSPDGKGGVVGSMDGNCRFYNVVDDRLELGARICLKGKKKLPGKRITGFQYCPGDSTKVMVTSADSQVRIICGPHIVCKFKGHKCSGTQSHATFSSDGAHVVSIGDDSTVRVWTYSTHDQRSSTRPKNLRSCETFPSRNASVAVPWTTGLPPDEQKKLPEASGPPADCCLASSLGFLLDAIYKGAATWPEEKLPRRGPEGAKAPSHGQAMGRPEFKFLRHAWLSALNHPHLWGLVVVTAGWDGCIRTFLNYGFPVRVLR